MGGRKWQRFKGCGSQIGACINGVVRNCEVVKNGNEDGRVFDGSGEARCVDEAIKWASV